MSLHPFLAKLLDGAEVVWKPLGDERFVEVANAARRPVKASLREKGDIPYYGANNIQDFVNGYTHDGEYVLIAEDGSASLENYSVQYATGKFWANNHVHVLCGNEGLDTKFLYYYLRTVNFIPFLSNKDRSKLTKGEMIKIHFPIPCPDNPAKSLAIQAEIVRILDAFTAMTAELTAELNMRKKQYNYYRDGLLTPSNSPLSGGEPDLPPAKGGMRGVVEWKTLGEVTLPTSNIRWRDVEGCYRYIDLTSVNIETKRITETTEIHAGNVPSRAQKLVEADDVIFATTRPAQQRYCLIDDSYSGAVASTGYCVLRANRYEVLPKWILHWISSTDFKTYVEDNQSGSAYPAISDAKVKDFKIPIPPLEEQARIVAILDKFDALTHSITEGLPREIELRQKQYEYYRDLLLGFPKDGCETPSQPPPCQGGGLSSLPCEGEG